MDVHLHFPYVISLSSSSSSYIFHAVGALVDPFRSHVSRSLFKGLPWFLLPAGGSISLPWVIYFEAFYLHVLSSFSCIPVICPKLVLFLTPLQFVYLFCNLSKCILLFFSCISISAAVILLASPALIVQVSLSYNKTGRASVLYMCIMWFHGV